MTVKSTENSIENRLKKLRNELYLNQAEMAVKLKITRAYWSALELGNRELTGNIIRSLITEFNVSADWLITGKGTMFFGGISSTDTRDAYEKKATWIFINIQSIIELTEKVTGPSPDYNLYLKEIGDVFMKFKSETRHGSLSVNYNELYDALLRDFFDLFNEYRVLGLSKFRSSQFEITGFNPPRNFSTVKIVTSKK